MQTTTITIQVPGEAEPRSIEFTTGLLLDIEERAGVPLIELYNRCVATLPKESGTEVDPSRLAIAPWARLVGAVLDLAPAAVLERFKVKGTVVAGITIAGPLTVAIGQLVGTEEEAADVGKPESPAQESAPA